MEHYFKHLSTLLRIEQEEDLKQYQDLLLKQNLDEKRKSGVLWYPVAIRGTELGRGDYLSIEIERTTHLDIAHQFRSGINAALFSNHHPQQNRIEGLISYGSQHRLKLNLRVDELPDWASDGKLGIELLFDNYSYEEMFAALEQAGTLLAESKKHPLLEVLTGQKKLQYYTRKSFAHKDLNTLQNQAVTKILEAEELAILHGPPGTGKTTTLVAAITALWNKDKKQILVVAPSNTAIDLITGKLAANGINVLRIGNPVRVSDHLQQHTLESKMLEHPAIKEIRQWKKQAGEYLNMAHKYKRNFGKAEREQRKALFDEAHKLQKEVIKTEDFIAKDLIEKAQVVTATLVGANHHSIKHVNFDTLIVDEAGQALEPALWIALLKAKKVVLAGDHQQLPPTVKSEKAAREGLALTLLEKWHQQFPESVVMLEEQYRMNEAIAYYPSNQFYKDQLRAAEGVKNQLLADHVLPFEFIDTAGSGFAECKENTQISNPEEALFLINYLKKLFAEVNKPFTVGIISPYKEQVRVLSALIKEDEELLNYLPLIDVNTVDSFQGQERDAILISMVRSNEDGQIGFLADIRRMNVAITRARKKVVLIGDSVTLTRHAFYHNLIGYTESNGYYKSIWEYSY